MNAPIEPRGPEGEKPLKVRRGRVDSVDLYEIKDGELDVLERGSPADLHLNFAIFLLSIAFSALAALVTATFTTLTAKIVFIVIVVVGALLGAFLLLSWLRNRSTLKVICARIRSRIPPDPAPPTEPSSEPRQSGNQPAG